jgi:hypothetical protein
VVSEFAYFRLAPYGDGIYIWSTNQEAVDSALATIREAVPDASVQEVRGAYRAHRLKGRDHELGRHILRELLSAGWEPFSVTRISTDTRDCYGATEVLHLRRQVE